MNVEIKLTGEQVKQLNDFMGGDYDMAVTLSLQDGDLIVWATSFAGVAGPLQRLVMRCATNHN